MRKSWRIAYGWHFPDWNEWRQVEWTEQKTREVLSIAKDLINFLPQSTQMSGKMNFDNDAVTRRVTWPKQVLLGCRLRSKTENWADDQCKKSYCVTCVGQVPTLLQGPSGFFVYMSTNFCYLRCHYLIFCSHWTKYAGSLLVYLCFCTFASSSYARKSQTLEIDPAKEDSNSKFQSSTQLVDLALLSTPALFWFHSSMGHCTVLFKNGLSLWEFLKYTISS